MTNRAWPKGPLSMIQWLSKSIFFEIFQKKGDLGSEATLGDPGNKIYKYNIKDARYSDT